MRKEIIVSVAALALFLSPLPSMAKPLSNVGYGFNAGNPGQTGYGGHPSNGGKSWKNADKNGGHGQTGYGGHPSNGGKPWKNADKNGSKPGGRKGGHPGGEYRHGTIYVKNINQTAINKDKVENKGNTRVTKISGPNASASTSATGASAAAVVTSTQGGIKVKGGINSKWDDKNYSKQAISSIQVKTITQTAINKGDVTNKGDVSGYGKKHHPDITGAGASATTNATGASTVVSLTSINDVKFPSVSVGRISQLSINNGKVTNLGNVSVGNLSGANAYAGTSAVGASAVVSVGITGTGGYKKH